MASLIQYKLFHKIDMDLWLEDYLTTDLSSTHEINGKETESATWDKHGSPKVITRRYCCH